jgi:carbon monoxide dehydrogenase subunit G
MKGYTMERTIPAPPQAVFAVLADLEQGPEWMPAVRSVQKVTDGPLAKGSKWIETRDTPKGPAVATVEVTEFEPEKVLAIRAETSASRLSMRFDLAADGRATKVNASAEASLKGLRFPWTGRFVKDLQASDADLLQRLEAQVVKAAETITPAAAAGTGKAGKSPKDAKRATGKQSPKAAKGASRKAGKSPKAAKRKAGTSNTAKPRKQGAKAGKPSK